MLHQFLKNLSVSYISTITLSGIDQASTLVAALISSQDSARNREVRPIRVPGSIRAILLSLPLFWPIKRHFPLIISKTRSGIMDLCLELGLN